MNKIIALLTSIILTATIFAQHVDPFHSSKNEKISITLDQLQFHNNNIYAFYHGDWHQVYALYSDGENLLIDDKQPSPETWYCNVCRTYHNADQKCPNTGRGKNG